MTGRDGQTNRGSGATFAVRFNPKTDPGKGCIYDNGPVHFFSSAPPSVQATQPDILTWDGGKTAQALIVATKGFREEVNGRALCMLCRAKGKASKVALVAVCGKLLRQAAAMIKKGQLFDEELALGA